MGERMDIVDKLISWIDNPYVDEDVFDYVIDLTTLYEFSPTFNYEAMINAVIDLVRNAFGYKNVYLLMTVPTDITYEYIVKLKQFVRENRDAIAKCDLLLVIEYDFHVFCIENE